MDLNIGLIYNSIKECVNLYNKDRLHANLGYLSTLERE